MDLNLSQEILEMKESIRDFVENTVEPVADQIEREDKIPERILEMSKEMGLFGLSIPEEYGGLGIGMVGKCAIYEELGRTSNGYTTVIGAHTGIGTVGIVELGSEEQKKKISSQNGNWRADRGFCFNRAKCWFERFSFKDKCCEKGEISIY